MVSYCLTVYSLYYQRSFLVPNNGSLFACFTACVLRANGSAHSAQKKGAILCVVSVWLCMPLPPPRLCHCLCVNGQGKRVLSCKSRIIHISHHNIMTHTHFVPTASTPLAARTPNNNGGGAGGRSQSRAARLTISGHYEESTDTGRCPG
jgi:hypothetical protein